MGQSSQQPRSEMTLGELLPVGYARSEGFRFVMTCGSLGCISSCLITSECLRLRS
jgi:hypothetical protein